MAWRIVGEYFENCSCDVLCPCITSSTRGPADTERCLVPFVCHVQEGTFNGVRLDGLTFIWVFDAPAIMSQGNWRAATYIDERADAAQRQALEAILSGNYGGAPETLAAAIGDRLGTKYVPITYVSQGLVRQVEVPGIMRFEIEGITAPGATEAMEISHVSHPMGSTLPIAKSRSGIYNDPDYQFSFDNTGKNGHYHAFTWQG
jgi:hypothetical protein